MLLLHALTLFLSGGLLFLVQPLFARMVLPLLGGSPAVWTTCMLFFQGALVASYAYAHLSVELLGVRRQAVMHAALLLLPLLLLPLGVSEAWRAPAHSPTGWLLWLLTVTIGLPFFVVAGTSPLLQRWLGATGLPGARDPYVLYAASNGGSMLALLAYPALLEPTLAVGEQSQVWSAGYALLLVLVWVCAIPVWRSAPAPVGAAGSVTPSDAGGEVTTVRRLRWTALAAAPSSLLLGVTTYLTTDIAVVPLLWVIPLALYLSTFILAFAPRTLVPHRLVLRLLPIAAVVMLLVLRTEATEPAWLLVCLHLAVFFVAAMACHGELARDRPAPAHLTEYYLWMSIGGMLGGAFNALVAPILFTSIAEYPVALIAACVLVPSYRPSAAHDSENVSSRWLRGGDLNSSSRWLRGGDLLQPALLAGATAALVLVTRPLAPTTPELRVVLTVGIPAVACFLLSDRPLRFGLALGAVLFAGSFDTAVPGTVLEAHRTFFGVHRVMHQALVGGGVNRLFHGTTIHGMQLTDPSRRPIRADEPLGYYHRDGPIGDVFRRFRARDGERLRQVGVVGLGAGELLAYAEPGDRFRVYELDPMVRAIATDGRLFTFYEDAVRRGADVEVVLGDARRSLAGVGDGAFDLVVLDAFSSDSIPVHLLTREALVLYARKLHGNGLLAFHVSNRYLRLEPVLAALAEDLGLAAAIRNDRASMRDRRRGHDSSDWVVLARAPEDLRPLRPDAPGSPWRSPASEEGVALWTDDFSNILGVFGPRPSR